MEIGKVTLVIPPVMKTMIVYGVDGGGPGGAFITCLFLLNVTRAFSGWEIWTPVSI